jgi:glucosylceramidase
MKTNLCAWGILVFISFSCTDQKPDAEWVATTENAYWQTQKPVAPDEASSTADVILDLSNTRQTIEGFGTCFNELGWTSLNVLEPQAREEIMKELFSPGIGANFTLCRMPVAANDFALDWYSYNETEGDFEMENFSIENDMKTLIPFIKNAQTYLPDLKIWASPWSPPSWMKYNKHYASRSTAAMARRFANAPRQDGESSYMFKFVDNGLPEDRQGYEGTDMFIQEDAYLKAYALYFAKFIDAYRANDIVIFGIMPQNEFNSAQIFPSCCWTAAGLANFIGKYLGPAMQEKGVEIMFGTMERANEALVDTILTDPVSGKYITGIGFQWAGKGAIPGLYKKYPNMKLYQSEQECGNGKNDWEGAVYSWGLMKHYLNNGTSGYAYWNTSLMQGGISRWGWAQNSLVVVNEDKTFTYTPEYYVMKHVSHYVKPGAKKLVTGGTYEDVLAFINPDKSIVVIAGNEDTADKTIHINVNGVIYSPTLKANSLNTLIIK